MEPIRADRWRLSNELLANRVFNSLDELERAQADLCQWMQAHT